MFNQNKKLLLVFNEVKTRSDFILILEELNKYNELNVKEDYYISTEAGFQIKNPFSAKEENRKTYIQELTFVFNNLSEYKPYLES